MTYRRRLLYLILIDSIIVSFSIYMSHFFLNPYFKVFDTTVLITSLVLLLTHHFYSSVFGLYRRIWRYASMGELRGIFFVVTLSIVSAALVQGVMYQDLFERALTVTWMLHIILIGGVRFAWKYYKTYGIDLFPQKRQETAASVEHEPKNRTLIIGAGSAGRMLARQIKESGAKDCDVVGFIDDDFTMKGLEVAGLPVLGTTEKLVGIIEKYNVNHIVIAMPSVERMRIKEVVEKAQAVCRNVQILPMIEDIAMGNVSVNQVRDVSIIDLLGREPVELDMDTISDTITDKTILVTGAGGSIGSEICRQVARFNPKTLVLLGHGENSIYSIEMELRESYIDQFNIVTEIADVQDQGRMMEAMKEHQPSVVYHAAAHKHVPLMERNPHESVKNNVIGTKNTAEAAHASGVDTFVMVSTDKAVKPTSVMGATKRMAEMFVQHMDKQSQTRFVAVRFGNVLGSRGSVIPLFKKQIQRGGPITVTHPEMNRYFMTIPEASRLVMQAGAIAKGGEIFVLDMGEPVKIVDLAENLIKLSGYSVDEIGIEFTGLRPGEKMYEELLGEDEVHDEQVWPKIYVGKSNEPDVNVVLDCVEKLEGFEARLLKERVLDIAHGRVLEEEKAVVAR